LSLLTLTCGNTASLTPTVPTPTPAPPTATATPIPAPVTPTDTPYPPLSFTSPVEGYVVLTNAGPGDPYYHAALRLSEYRDGDVITFRESPSTAENALRTAEVRFVALVVLPETMDEDLAWEVYQLAKGMDAEYDTDFAYGFISGITADDVLHYVDNLAAYEGGLTELNTEFRVVWRTGEGAISGGAGSLADDDAQAAVDLFAQMGFDAARIDGDQLTKEEILAEISQSGVLYFNLHASPTYFEISRRENTSEGVSAEDIPEMERALLIFHTGCFAGAVHKWYNQSASAPPSYDQRARFVDPSESLALNFLRNGTLAYVGHLCMWGPGGWPVILMEELAADPSMTLGELMVIWYNLPSGPNIIEESAASDIIGMDNNRFYNAAMVLYGDPALRIIR
ncbi:MAG: C25 family cysteine peptidase, partial [Anaerolineae bacterium]